MSTELIQIPLLAVAAVIDELVQVDADDVAVTWIRNGYRVEVRVIAEP